MKIPRILITLVFFAIHGLSVAKPAEPRFTGNWEIDLRTPAQRAAKAECGHAYFMLEQHGTEVIGDHGYATPGCAQVNNGGPVRGWVRQGETLLEVTSTKQGAVVRGKATLVKGKLKWRTLEVLQPGTPGLGAPLILDKGLLYRLPD